MSERTLAQPLSGDEIVKAILDKFERQLRRDCFLNGACAYESFEGNVSYELRLLDSGRVPVVTGSLPVRGGKDGAAIGQSPAVGTIAFETKPPNEVRLETGQAVPTLVEQPNGQSEIKHVQYRRRESVEVDGLPADLPGEPVI